MRHFQSGAMVAWLANTVSSVEQSLVARTAAWGARPRPPLNVVFRYAEYSQCSAHAWLCRTRVIRRGEAYTNTRTQTHRFVCINSIMPERAYIFYCYYTYIYFIHSIQCSSVYMDVDARKYISRGHQKCLMIFIRRVCFCRLTHSK